MLKFSFDNSERKFTEAFIKRARKQVGKTLEVGVGGVRSSSGLTASLAIEWFEERNISYHLVVSAEDNGFRMYYVGHGNGS